MKPSTLTSMPHPTLPAYSKTFPRVFEEAKKLAKDRLEKHGKTLRQFKATAPFHGYTDAWLESYLDSNLFEKCSPKAIYILQDWGSVDDAETAEAIRKSTRLDHSGDNDRTIKRLSDCLGDEIASGSIVVFNAVWALRPNGAKRNGYLSDEVHRASFPVWVHMVDYFAGTGKLRDVYLCGKWAAWKGVEFGRKESGAMQLNRWRKWCGLETLSEKEAQRFEKISFHYIPHPAAISPQFCDYVAK